MVTIKDGCGATSCCDWKQKLEEAYKRATASVNKIGDDAGNVYFPDGTGYVKVPLPTKAQVDNIAQIDGIKASVDELNKTVPALEAQVTGVTESLVSNVEVLNGTTAGKFKVRIERNKAALIDSNDYDLSKVNSIELIQGSGPAMVKAQLTLSDGTVLRSDDFLFTTESIGTDVYISSFTFKAGNVDGTISADIGLNNGTTLEANNFVVPTDPSVVSTITDLQTRMTAVENGSGVTGLDALKATVDTHTSEIAQLTNDVGNLTTSKVNVAQGTENAGKVLGIGSDGNVTPVDAGGSSGGGEVWEKIDFNNWPTNWAEGDRIKVSTKLRNKGGAGGFNTFSVWSPFIEFIIPSSNLTYMDTPIQYGSNYELDTLGPCGFSLMNNGDVVWISKFHSNTTTGQRNSISASALTSNYTEEVVKLYRLKQST